MVGKSREINGFELGANLDHIKPITGVCSRELTGVMFADKAYFLAFKAVAKSPAKTTAQS